MDCRKSKASLPPINTLFTENNNLLPIIKVNDEPESDHKLQVLEPHLESPLSPNLSSPSSATSSIASSPLFLPINDSSPFLLPPLQDHHHARLSEPPVLELKKQDYETIFGPKRKRGRPLNATQPKHDHHFTFIQPTVWDVNQQPRPKKTSDIPKKKRGRKPKQQFSGNSCFVWKDLTAPRSPNKKR